MKPKPRKRKPIRTWDDKFNDLIAKGMNQYVACAETDAWAKARRENTVKRRKPK